MKSFIVFSCFLFSYFVSGQEDLVVRSQKCLDCICYGSSFCNATAPCITYTTEKGAPGMVCGPYRITRDYWEDAGKPGDDYISCVSTRKCSEMAVLNYMNRYGTDCDGDGQVSCADYARIHTAGVTECGAPWVELTAFWTQFKQCDSGTQSVQSRAMLRGV